MDGGAGVQLAAEKLKKKKQLQKIFQIILQQEEQLILIPHWHTDKILILLHEDLIRAILPASVVCYTDTIAKLFAKVKFAYLLILVITLLLLWSHFLSLHVCTLTNIWSHILQPCAWSDTNPLAQDVWSAQICSYFCINQTHSFYESLLSYIPDIIWCRPLNFPERKIFMILSAEQRFVFRLKRRLFLHFCFWGTQKQENVVICRNTTLNFYVGNMLMQTAGSFQIPQSLTEDLDI